MATLNWRTATTVILHDNLIPNPNAEHDLLGAVLPKLRRSDK